MALYTSDYLKSTAKNKTFSERIELSAQKDKQHGSFDVFLCHSYLDRDEVEGLYIVLTRLGLKVYVDWIIDPHLDRNNVTKETAELVRQRLHSSKTLLLALSANANLSKWVPWELGYVDGRTRQCGLIPVSKDNSNKASFTRTEYLLLYPYIEKPNDFNLFTDKLWAVESANSYIDFKDWLNGNKPKYASTRFF